MTALLLSLLLFVPGAAPVVSTAGSGSANAAMTLTCGSDLSMGAVPTANIPDAVRAQVRAYLGTIDTRIPASRWRALGDPGVAALEEIARSKATLPTRRARAVGAAGLIGGARARCLALELARTDPAPVVRQSAVRALGQLLPPAELSRALTPLLHSDSSLGVRAVAATVLSAKAQGACAAVRAEAEREPPSHRAAFSQALERCAAPR